MDYEKKYKEALGWMQSLYDGLHGATKEDAEHYFPELKESEDERIRKTLIKFHKSTIDVDGIKGKDIIAWLEKQGEQKPAWSEEDEAHIMAIDLAVNRCLGKWHCCGEKCPISEHNPWLKSLKDRVQPQSTWKPSDAQMTSITCAVRKMKESACYDLEFVSLLNDLKKLREE